MLSKILNLTKKILRKFKFKILIDNEKQIGNFKHGLANYRTDIKKEEVSRKYILEKPGKKLNFLDVGARDGKLDYLLGIESNLKFNREMYEKNHEIFKSKYHYYGLDLSSKENSVIQGDICDKTFLNKNSKYALFFDLIYCNNVFEHLKEPWTAAKNIMGMLKQFGVGIIITPFSLRYHECPKDYFRYSHSGLAYLFERCGKIKILESGYDISGRRNNWQGTGLNNDICPQDKFGAWRENWFTVLVFEKL